MLTRWIPALIGTLVLTMVLWAVVAKITPNAKANDSETRVLVLVAAGVAFGGQAFMEFRKKRRDKQEKGNENNPQK